MFLKETFFFFPNLQGIKGNHRNAAPLTHKVALFSFISSFDTLYAHIHVKQEICLGMLLLLIMPYKHILCEQFLFHHCLVVVAPFWSLWFCGVCLPISRLSPNAFSVQRHLRWYSVCGESTVLSEGVQYRHWTVKQKKTYTGRYIGLGEWDDYQQEVFNSV